MRGFIRKGGSQIDLSMIKAPRPRRIPEEAFKKVSERVEIVSSVECNYKFIDLCVTWDAQRRPLRVYK